MKILFPEAKLVDLFNISENAKPKYFGLNGYNLIAKDKMDRHKRKMTISEEINLFKEEDWQDIPSVQLLLSFKASPTKLLLDKLAKSLMFDEDDQLQFVFRIQKDKVLITIDSAGGCNHRWLALINKDELCLPGLN